MVNLYTRYCKARIALSDYSDTINITRFLCQIYLTDKSDQNNCLYANYLYDLGDWRSEYDSGIS